MNAVVTGSNGFIGKNLTKLLLKQGFHVRCIDLVHSHKYENASYYTIDLADKNAILKSDVLQNVDYVFHVAGVTKRSNLDEFRLGNVKPTENLVQLLKMQNSLKRFVFISSQAAAGPSVSCTNPVNEETTPHPVEAYGMSKLEAEYLIRFQSNIPFTIIRPCSVYGPGDADFIPIFQQIRARISVYPNNKDHFISIIFVDDLVNGIFNAAIASNTKDRVYFISSEKPVSWRDVYRTIAQIQGKKTFEINIPKYVIHLAGRLGDLYSKLTGRYLLVNRQKIALSEPKYWICSSAAAGKDFGFKPQYTLEEGMLKTYIHIREKKLI